MMDWVGAFNAYGAVGAKQHRNNSNNNSNGFKGGRTTSLKLSRTINSNNNNNNIVVVKGVFPRREIIKSASSASIMRHTSNNSNSSSSILSRDNIQRDGIYHYEMTEKIKSSSRRGGSLKVRIKTPGELMTSRSSPKLVNENNSERSKNGEGGHEDAASQPKSDIGKDACQTSPTGEIPEIKITEEKKRRFFSFAPIIKIIKSASFSSGGGRPFPPRVAKPIGEINPESNVANNSSDNIEKANGCANGAPALPNQSGSENFLAQPIEPQLEEKELSANHCEYCLCTCSTDDQGEEVLVGLESSELEDIAEGEDDPESTMPRNSNYHAHPKFNTSAVPLSKHHQHNQQLHRQEQQLQHQQQQNGNCKIHFKSFQSGIPISDGHHHGMTTSSSDHNQNVHSNGNANLCHHHHQQQQHHNSNHICNGTAAESPAGGDSILHQPKESKGSMKKEFIPSFVLLDACKSAHDKKIFELVKKLSVLSSDEVAPVANFQDQAGRTSLSYTCSSGNVMMVEELSKLRRLDPNLGDVEGNTPLHHAAQAGHSEVVDLMLSRFNGIVDPNCRNSTGLTPLMKAALQGRTRCTKSLISAGANPYLKDYSRQLTAEGWARLCGRHICAEVIVKSTKDYCQKHPKSPTDVFNLNYFRSQPNMPTSKSNMELKRMNSDESPYYHLYNARTAISGAAWLKNKIKKAIGATTTATSTSTMMTTTSSSTSRAEATSTNNINSTQATTASSSRPSPGTYALVTNISNATICASSLLLPSIKPLLADKQKQIPKPLQKMHIPSVQVTPVRR